MSKIVVFDAFTETEFLREMTDEELKQWQLDQEEATAKAQAEAEAQAKREAALSKLAALGLDTDDLKALGL